MLNKETYLKANNRNRFVFNTFLKAVTILALIFLFSGRKTPEIIDYYYTICFVITLIIPISINLYVLFPRFLKRERYLLFAFCFLLNLVVFASVNPLFFEFVANTFLPDYYFISYHNTVEIFFIFFIVFVLSSLIKLGEDWVYLNQMENQILQKEKEQIEQQLYYLKGQINPHFLFNSLNVIYSLAVNKKEDVEKAILQLSDILRYVIYDTEVDKIPLEKEVDLIKNYIAFEKNRQVKDSKVSFQHDVSVAAKIYPMLLLPLIENSFKHGLKSGISNPFVDIRLKESNGVLNFEVSNNFKTVPTTDKNKSGIGLDNIQKNLNLIYQNNHELKSSIDGDVYKVSLQINLL
ncbi:MAG: hypothetical protein CMB99_09910 [Flavobacteriaceae bacterium]|nr:hypothetical protein [Flavobacteriaceae bacterium]|tara:strand:- start:355239 stop:356285 length:1047 start_codon:yes stop_codon:yes gene_type:complete